MGLETMLVWVVAISLIILFGYGNYKAAFNRSKKIYCEVYCKEENNCNFLNEK